MKYDLLQITLQIEELYDWVEELHLEIRNIKRGRNEIPDNNSAKSRTYSSIIEELYGRDIEFDGSESGIKMTPWDATMDITEENDNNDWQLDASNVYDDLYEILVSKQKDYGPDNIRKSPGGPLNGLTVRLYDKLARLNNLLETGATPENESLRDTFIDIANYGVIGIMILDDTFPKSKDN